MLQGAELRKSAQNIALQRIFHLCVAFFPWSSLLQACRLTQVGYLNPRANACDIKNILRKTCILRLLNLKQMHLTVDQCNKYFDPALGAKRAVGGTSRKQHYYFESDY